MKFTAAAVLAAAAGASAHYGANATVVTEVVTAYTTYCPGPTQIVHGDKTYTVTEATTLTITDCPCTITKPVIPTSTVICHDQENCGAKTYSTVPGPYNTVPGPYHTPGPYNTPIAPTAPVVPGGKPGGGAGYPAPNPGYPGANPSYPAGNAPVAPVGTGAPVGTKPGSSPSSVPTAGAAQAAVLSGAGLAGIVGVAAFLL